MEYLSNLLPIIIYILLIVLIILLIIISLKLIKTIDKTNDVVDNAYKKVKSLDGLFNIIDVTSNKITGISEKLFGGVSGLIEKIFKKEDKKDE